ncbi:hypothetical protein TraAM80_04451 [Trypanosoma rangeli]|uniref:Basal body-orientation factor 1 n=1 Tax=Trypanosoma rangeli TaxID=5698 RepID=A0A422NJA6_TRYRA|nr:uncharacterized protein TraAM80_04451 [Trypanosoma rangeli]RNF05529.1 hypothetical protein TraAM80_04451 [Trypanosoma rangeli]|eukprot:RNF05529.1 hypothetical protein TraAM80_04451 [Trypanosoma rangeli]
MKKGLKRKVRGERVTTFDPTITGAQRHGALLGDGHETESVLVAATLANRQLQVSSSASAYYQKVNQKLAQENVQLENDLEKKEQDASAVMKAFEDCLEAVKSANAKLKGDLSAARESAQREVVEAMAAIQDMLESRDYHLLSLQKRIEWLEEELASVNSFRDARDTHRREMEALKKAYADEKDDHARDSQTLRLQLMEERVRIKAEEQRLLERHEEDVRKLAQRLLSQKTREVDEENQQLLGEKLFLWGDANAARERAETVQRENIEFRRNAALARSAEAEYAAGAARQRREMKLLKEQIETTEENLNKVVEDYEQRLQKQAKEHATALRQLTQERDAAKCSAERFCRELVKLRSLSQKMVKRRTELEMFFYDALAQVRREKLEENRRGTRSIGYHQTNSSFFQPTPPRLRKRDDEPLMISDRGMQLPLTPFSRLSDGEGNTPCQNKETLFGDGGMDTNTLPLVALTRSECDITHNNRLIPAKEWHYGGNGVLQTRFPPLAEEPLLPHSDFSCIPSAPKLKDLQSIEISQLSWKDKERVLQLLFKQLQGRVNSSKVKQCTSKDDANFLVGGVAVNPETHTFLTE